MNTFKHRRRGVSTIELAIVVAVLAALLAIAAPVYLNSRNEAYDSETREELEHAANQAASRLVEDRYYSYIAYTGPSELTSILESEDPQLHLVPLADGLDENGDPDPTEIQYINEYVDATGDYDAIGVGIDTTGTGEPGALVLASMSQSGKCWLIKHDPSQASGNGMQFALGDPDFCGFAANWTDDPDGPAANQPPVAGTVTLPVQYETQIVFSLITDAGSYDPDGGPNPLTFSVLPSSQLQPADLDSFGAATGAVSWTPPNGESNVEYQLDYQVSDGADTDTGRITLQVGSAPGVAGLAVTLTCDASVPYNQLATCTAVPNDLSATSFAWSAPGASPFDCEDSDTCLLTRTSEGKINVAVTVHDDAGATATDTALIDFIAVAPVVTLTCDDNVSYVDEGFCTASASDLNNDPLTYVWAPDDTATPASITSPACPSAATCGITVDGPTGVGTPVDVDITVLDPTGLTDTTSSSMSFVNLPPTTPTIVCGDPVPHTTDLTCTVSGSSDPEGGAITYTWAMSAPDDESGRGESPSPATCAGASCTFTHPNPLDTVLITATATDPIGETSSDQTTTSFVNTPPVIRGVPCTSPHEYLTEDSTCDVSGGAPPWIVADPEGDDTNFGYTYSWSQPDGSPNSCGNSSSCTFTRTTPGSVTTTLTVTDEWGDSSSRDGTAVFINKPPSVVVTCSGTLTNKDGNPAITCTATETSGDPGPFDYDWTASDDHLGLDAQSQNGVAASSHTVTIIPDRTTGTFTPSVTVTDPYGATGSDDGDPITVFDESPSATLTGCTTDTGSNCTLTVTVTDPDDTNATITWPTSGTGWAAPANTTKQAAPGCDTTVTANGSDTATCYYSRNIAGSIPIQVTATTGVPAPTRSTTATATATFSNRGPTLNNASCVTTNGSNCNLSMAWSDPEGDPLTFTWPDISVSVGTMQNRVAGECNGSDAASTNTCSYNWGTSYGGGHLGPTTATVRACDPSGACDTATISLQWDVRPNNAPSATISCTDGTTTKTSGTLNASAAGKRVTCTVTGTSDPDGDGISHTYWNIGGSPSNCNSGGGGYASSCAMSSTNTTATARVSVRDLYCGVARCAAGDGSLLGTSPTVTITWPAVPPPSSGGGCSPGIRAELLGQDPPNHVTETQVFYIGGSNIWPSGCPTPISLVRMWYGGGYSSLPRTITYYASSGRSSDTVVHLAPSPGENICVHYCVPRSDLLARSIGHRVTTRCASSNNAVSLRNNGTITSPGYSVNVSGSVSVEVSPKNSASCSPYHVPPSGDCSGSFC